MAFVCRVSGIPTTRVKKVQLSLAYTADYLYEGKFFIQANVSDAVTHYRFDLPPGDKSSPARTDQTFVLFPDQEEAVAAGYGHHLNVQSSFAGSVAGLAVGADVTMHGLKIGEVTDIAGQSFKVTAQGGVIEVLKARFEDGKKLAGAEVAQTGGINAGSLLGG